MDGTVACIHNLGRKTWREDTIGILKGAEPPLNYCLSSLSTSIFQYEAGSLPSDL
jgi:hypothetical protein